MPFIDNDGVTIHYEAEGTSGPPIVMVHGMGMSGKDWYRAGYPGAMRDDFRLLIVDSRGFGESDKPHDPEAYSRERKVSDIVAVLDAEGIDTAHYWGFSMGASIGWAFGMQAPERARSLIIGAYPVLPPEVTGNDRVRWESRAKLMRLGMDVYVTALEMMNGPMDPEARERLLANDNLSYAAQQIANISWGSPAGALEALTLPVFVYVGTEDNDVMPGNYERTVASAKRAPNATLLEIPGYRHRPAFDDSALMMPHVREWIAKIEEQLA